MKLFLVLLVAASVLGCVLSCSDDDFSNFKSKYGKKYADENENNLRKEIFCKNLNKIQAHNEQYKKGLSSYKLGINQFADMTAEDFQNSGYVMRPGLIGH